MVFTFLYLYFICQLKQTNKTMETLKVTGIQYFRTRRGIAYTCKTNINGLTIENEGDGSGTYIYNDGSVDVRTYYDMYSEDELEELINEYEESLLEKNQ